MISAICRVQLWMTSCGDAKVRDLFFYIDGYYNIHRKHSSLGIRVNFSPN